MVCSDVAPVGGMERASYELCRRLLDRGWHLTLIARTCTLPAVPALRFVRLRSPSRPVSLALISDFVLGSAALARYRSGVVHTVNPIVGNRVDLIGAHFCEPAFLALRISRSSRDTTLYRLNTWLASRVSLGLEHWNYRPGRVRSIACVSRGLVRDIQTYYPSVSGLLRTIPNGVDWDAFAPQPELRRRIRAELGIGDDELVAAFAGGDWHRKGLRHAIEGMAAADGWRLAVMGDGDQKRFRDLAAQWGAADRIVFVGKVPDPIPYYLAADALVAPSHYEAFSLVAIEGAAAGLPLIVPRMNGTEELVEDGVNGWFTERDGAAIAGRLRQLRDDPGLRTSMATAARRSAERYDWERIADAFEAVYAELKASRS